MIYVVKIPHQMPPEVWSAYDEADFANIIRDACERDPNCVVEDDGSVSCNGDTFDDCEEYLRHDLSSWVKLESLEQAVEFVAHYAGHQFIKARAALAKEIGRSEDLAVVVNYDEIDLKALGIVADRAFYWNNDVEGTDGTEYQADDFSDRAVLLTREEREILEKTGRAFDWDVTPRRWAPDMNGVFEEVSS